MASISQQGAHAIATHSMFSTVVRPHHARFYEMARNFTWHRTGSADSSK